VVLAGWALVTVMSTVILTVISGLILGLDMDPTALQTASQVAAVGLLGAVLAAPMALVSSWRRGYLPGFVALVAVVVVTQVVTAIGAGAWFPYAAPALWRGSCRQRGIGDPAAATAPGCGYGRRDDAQLVAARRSAVTLTALNCDHTGSNCTACLQL
jgi:hypothetical protein